MMNVRKVRGSLTESGESSEETVCKASFPADNLRDRRHLDTDPSLYRSAIRKWLIYLTLLIAAAVLLTDLVVVLYDFLNVDLTVQFIAKTAVVAVVAGLIFLYYLADVRRGDGDTA